MEIIFELLFEFLGEYVLAFLVELVSSAFGSVFGSVFRPHTAVDGGTAHSETAIAPPARRFKPGWFGRLIAGIVLGAVSVWLFPASVAKTQDVRLAVLIGVPIACGLSMGLIGSFKRKRGREAAALESFRNGFLFALPFVAIRFFFAH